MIKNLFIKDFAILDEINLALKDGFTVITGETGAGKSLLLQALNISLGGKTSKTMVRSRSDKAIVETEINNKYYRRIINKSGRTKSFVDDEPLTESNFRLACNLLVDFHGQHEQQFIMNEESHIDYLDAYCGLEEKVKNCTSIFNSIKSKEKELERLIEKKQIAEQQIELMNFQLTEIQAINPILNEDVELENELSKLKHLDEIAETIQRVTRDLTDDDEAIYNRGSMALKELERLEQIDEQIKEYAELLRTSIVNMQETSISLNEYLNGLDHDKARLTEVQDRLGAIDSLKRKYGGSIESILDTELDISDKLKGYSSIDTEIIELEKIINAEKDSYNQTAVDIHNVRVTKAGGLSESIVEEMRKLNMPGARFEIMISQKEVDDSMTEFSDKKVLGTEKGIDNIQFLLSANPGEKLKPLVEIASGGEISRIMLAIKTVFQKDDPVATLIFDEIDSGISGNAAEKVGQSLHNLAKTKQVICITHLPQIARLSTNHLHVEKLVDSQNTYVKVNYLDDESKRKVINELTSSITN